MSENELEKLKKVKEDLPDSCGITLSVHEVMQQDIGRLERNVDEMNGKLERVLEQLARLTGEGDPSSTAARQRSSSVSSREGDFSSAVAAAGGEKSAPASPAAPAAAAAPEPHAEAPETPRVPLEDWLKADQTPTKVLI